MPAHKSSEKRIQITKKRTAKNRMVKSRIRNATEDVLASKEKTAAQDALKKAFSVIDKSAIAGVIHRNKAANQKARLSRFVSKLGA